MVGNCEDSQKKLTKFVASLQIVGIFDVLDLLKKSESDEMIIQIRSFERATRHIISTPEYRMEVYKIRIKVLENNN